MAAIATAGTIFYFLATHPANALELCTPGIIEGHYEKKNGSNGIS